MWKYVGLFLIAVLIITCTKEVLSDTCYNGKASYYGKRFHGNYVAEWPKRFDMNAMTAAHKSLPFGTMVEVTNKSNNKKVTVSINDRGPFIKGRVLDLSKGAMQKIGGIQQGVVNMQYCIK